MGKKVFRSSVMALLCGSMMFGLGFGCLGSKWMGKLAQGVAVDEAGHLLDVFVMESVTRGARAGSALADAAASNALCKTDPDKDPPDGCDAADNGPQVWPFSLGR